LINENMANDYRPIPELDRYEEVDIDDQSYDDIQDIQRRQAEHEIAQRKRR
jgi:DNA replication licensing factor MCM2